MIRQWKRSMLKSQLPTILACLLYFGASANSWAAPTGGVVTAGSATISSSGVTTTINQATNKAAINWQSFGIASGETVRFVQPSASSIALNRVVGSDASAIYGTLSANGQVFLINPNGIMFAPGAQVNVGGLVASTLNISDSDFLNGNYRFSKAGKAGSVINQGRITTADGGYVAFLGPQVQNEGIVAARVIGMGAGDKVSLDFNGDSLLKLTVDTVAAGASTSNSGTLLADGGTVLMTTGTKEALLSTVVNNSGLIQARTVNNVSGTIILEGGSANIGGTLDASAPNGGNGGFIETSGASVNMIAGLKVTTQAAQGTTGTWLIDPTDYTIGTGATGDNYWNNEGLGTALNGSNITVETAATGSDAGDINVLAPVSWSAHQLTLSAHRNINIRSTLTATGTSTLDMTSGTGGSGSIDYGLTASGFAGKVDFGTRSGSGFLTINGSGYNVISNLTELQALQLRNNSVKYYLGTDLDANGTAYTPIGSGSGNAFQGTFDGGGHTISNLTINRAGQENTGLFGYTDWATLANVGLTNVSISGGSHTGGLAGVMGNSGLHNSYATGSVSGGSSVGGLVGTLGAGSIANSYAAVSVTSSGSYVGGLVGYAGENPSISASYATGSVSGTSKVGGLVGYLNQGSVNNSYASGSVNAEMMGDIGGLVGYSDGTITASYATGRLTGSQAADFSGLVGALSSSSVDNGYWDTQTSGAYDSWAGGTGRTTAQLMSALPDGFSSDVWGIIPGTSYPYLKWSHPTTPQVVSGFVKNAAGWAQAGQTVQTLANGNLVGSTGSGANGFYYMLLGNDSIANSKSVLSFVGTQGGTATFTTAANQNLTGFDITTGRVTVTHNDAIDVTSLLGQAKGSNTDDTRYTVNGFNVSVNGDLNVTAAGDVVTAGALTVSGATTVTAQNGATKYDITLGSGNDFTGAVSLTGNNVTLTDVNALKLGASTVNNLSINAGGAVTQTGALAVSGVTTVNAGGNDITLDDTANDFTNRVSLTGNNVTLRDVNALWLGGSTIGGDLNVTAGGNVTQTAGLTVAGATTVNAGSHDISLWNIANDFTGAVSLTGQSVTLRDVNILTLGAITAPGSFTLSAGGDIDALNSTVSTGLFDLKAGTWQQLNAPLPSFSATDFRISGGTFIRALSGNGTSGSPYQLSDIYGLQGAGSSGMLAKSYTLANNIDASGTSAWNGGAGFKPIGSEFSAFTGSLDGAGHTISGLTISRPGTNDVGLFGYTNGATLANVGLTNLVVSGAGDVGGLVGEHINGSITNAYTTGTVNGLASVRVGGLVGYNSGGSIGNSYAAVSVNGGGQVGGLVGTNSGTISNSYATGSAYGSGGFVGGLLGTNSGTISNSYATGSVTGGSNLGGLVGFNNGSITSSYWDTQTSGQATSAGGIGLTTAQMKDASNYSTWDTTTVWYLNGGYTAPLLRSFLTPLTVSADAATKVYDGTTAATFSNITYTPVSGVFDAAKVGGTLAGTGKNVGSHDLTGLYTTSQQGYLIDYDSNSTLTITPRALTASVTAANKVYNGTTEATITGGITLGNLVVGDTVSATYTSGDFADQHVGNNKAVTLAGLGLTGVDAGNYSLAADSVTSSASITPASLTITAVTDSKPYDGNTTSTGGPTYSGLTIYDSIDGLTQTFVSKNVMGAGNSTLNVSGYTIHDGNNGQNYTVTTQSAAGTITPRELTAALTGTTSKVYDGTTAATLTNANFQLFDLVAGDTVAASATSAAYADKNVNTAIGVTATGLSISGADAGNYTISGDASGAIGVITKRPLTATATVADKVYNGTTAATISGILLNNMVDGDDINVTNYSGTFADKHVGTNKTIFLNSIEWNGADNANYEISMGPIASNGSITPKELTLSALGMVEKVYNGNTLATVNAGNQPTLQGYFVGDNVTLTFTNASASYDNKNVGDNKAVTLSGLTLGGTDAGNYQLASTSISGNVGKITPASLTITASSNSKVYDGTLSASATPTFSGLVGSDTLGGLAQAYTDKNAGNDKTLAVTGYTVNDGNGGNNYIVSLVNDTTGIITPAQLIYTAAAASREQGRDNPLLSGSIIGIGSGDSLATITSGALAWNTTATKNSAAGRYAIDGSGLSVTSGNYLADILQAPGNATALTVRAQDNGYKGLLPWIIQGNDSMSLLNPQVVPAGSNGSRQTTGQYLTGGYSGGSPVPTGGINVNGLPLQIIGTGINTGNHGIATAELMNLSQLEVR